MKPSEKIERKFIESIDVDDWMVLTDTGWEDISQTNKTIEYEVWNLETENGLLLECADTHIIFNYSYEEVFVKDLKVGDMIITQNGFDFVKKVSNTKVKENMYDLSVNSKNHRYYTNGILSHNTTIIAAILLHYALFNRDKVIAILANKHAQAKEIVSRIRQMYEYLPFFIQQGALVYNKNSIKFENGSELFCASTSNDGIRGRSCVSGKTKVKIRNKKTGEIKFIDIQEVTFLLKENKCTKTILLEDLELKIQIT